MFQMVILMIYKKKTKMKAIAYGFASNSPIAAIDHEGLYTG